MAEASPLQSGDDQDLLQVALQRPFEPADVPLSASSTSPSAPAPVTPSDPPTSRTEEDTWQAAYASQVSEWRAQSSSARSKAELARANWETIRAQEDAERQALGRPPESANGLGDHITASVASADEVVSRSLAGSVAGSVASLDSPEHEHAPSRGPEENPEHVAQAKADDSPSQPWEHLSSSQSSYPSMSFPEASVPQSPSQQHAALAPSSAPAPAPSHPRHTAGNPSNIPPSTLPSIMDNRIAPRTRLSLVLSSLAINLLLPFVNGVMLGFGEIFAKEVIVGWFGWKRHGSTAALLGLRR